MTRSTKNFDEVTVEAKMSPPSAGAAAVPARGRHSARKPVLYSFAGITVLGLVVFTLSWLYPFMIGDQIGPGFLPGLASAGLILMGVLLLKDELRSGSILEGDGANADAVDQTPAERKATHRRLLYVAIFTPVSCLLFPILGLLPSLTILAFVLSAFVEKMPKLVSAIVALATFAVLYLIFVTVLSVQLPFGIFDPRFWGAS